MSFHDPRATRVAALAAVDLMVRATGIALHHGDRSSAQGTPCVPHLERLIIDAANRTIDRVGDGGLRTIVLASALVADGIKLFATGEDPRALADALRCASQGIIERLRGTARSIRVEDVVKIARTAAGGDAVVAELVGTAMRYVGADGFVRVTTATCDAGASVENISVVAPVTIRWAPLENLRDARVVLLDEEPASPVHDSDPGAPATLVVSTRPLPAAWHVLKAMLVEIEGPRRYQAEVLEDLAAFTGATVGNSHGSVASASARTGELRLKCGGGTRLVSHRNALLRKLDRASRAERDRLHDRISILDERYATIRLEGSTESERVEVARRTERAIVASRAALARGVVTGGGIALLRACSGNDRGTRLLGKAAETLIAWLAASRGVSGTMVLQDVRELGGSFGFDAVRGRVADLDAAGVCDPFDTVEAIVSSAVDVACSILGLDGEWVLVRGTKPAPRD